MGWEENCRVRLPEYLDKNGDLLPPWEKFPTYERFTLGWRMGAGEDWMMLWHVFLEQLAPDFDSRLSYLRRHAPAPYTWADFVYKVLHARRGEQDEDEDEDEDSSEEAGNESAAERRKELQNLGLIESDVAFRTWLAQQEEIRWPWSYADTPETAARYWTREFWFWSRQVTPLRAERTSVLPAVPDAWKSCAAAFNSGRVEALDLRRGLLSLAHMLAAGEIKPPWQLGLEPRDFSDSFEDDMGYIDAFRLWAMSAFDDAEQVQHYLEGKAPPEEWQEWVSEQLIVA